MEAAKLAVIDIFSKRQRRLRGDLPEVYTYEEIPQELRVQIVHILMKALGDSSQYVQRSSVGHEYNRIVHVLYKEYGVFSLSNNHGRKSEFQQLLDFILQEDDVERVLSGVELAFQSTTGVASTWDYLHRGNAQEISDDAATELNHRFQEHGVGYQFSDGKIIRVDSQYIHAEIMKPALAILQQRHYSGARQEFLNAHGYYRKGDTKGTLSECLKAVESVMKSICDRRKWAYSKNATAKELIDVCFQNGLVPTFWQSHYASLRSLLESSVPTGRNKLSGHGQGAKPVSVPTHIAGYMLHMIASSIVFLAESDNQTR